MIESRWLAGRGVTRCAVWLVLTGALLAGCAFENLGFPRVAVEVAAPDGQAVAWVRNHPEIDLPNQSLWLRTGEGRGQQILKLSPDMDRCDEIVWAEDGSRVVYLVNRERAVVVDRASAEVVLDEWLVEIPRANPPSSVVADLGFSDGADALSFQRCPPTGAECGEWVELPLPARRSLASGLGGDSAEPLVAGDVATAVGR